MFVGFFPLQVNWSFVLVSCVDRLGDFMVIFIPIAGGGRCREYLKRGKILTKGCA